MTKRWVHRPEGSTWGDWCEDDELGRINLITSEWIIPLGEMRYPQELATWLRANGRSSFLLTAPPLRLPGAAGSPLNPIATV